jgi:uncharacterized protein YhbP (UPF0306 family)
MNELKEFLQSQRILSISKVDDGGTPYATPLFVGLSDDLKLYFVSPKDAEHSQHLLQNSTVAFSMAWHLQGDFSNRKGVQGKGTCQLAESEEIEIGVSLHNKNYPQFAERITPDYIREGNSAIWVIEPKWIKYWDDELYGNGGTKEFNF